MKLARDKLLAAALALGLIGGGGICAVLNDDDGDGRPDSITISFPAAQAATPGPATTAPVQIDENQEQSPAEQLEAATRVDPASGAVTPDVHEDAKDETPPGISEGESKLAQRTPPGLETPQPVTGAQNYSCPRRYVRNRSSRNGRRVSMLVLHITVSPPGSLNAIRGLFDRPSFGASSTFGAELSGRCEQWVPFGEKPWTNGAFNPVTETWEIITYLRTRSQWLNQPLISRGILAAMVRDRAKARGIPLRLVDPSGCTPVAGITDHDRLECGNTHVDVGDGFPWDVFMRQVRAGTTVATRPPSSSARRQCQQLRAYRRKAARPGGLNGTEKVRAKRLRNNLKRHGYSCGKTKVVRRG